MGIEGSSNSKDGKDRLMSAVALLLPSELQEDIKKNFLNSIRLMFENMEFVTREEIEVQEIVLRRARMKIRELESRICVLESELKRSRSTKDVAD